MNYLELLFFSNQFSERFSQQVKTSKMYGLVHTTMNLQLSKIAIVLCNYVD